MVDWWSGGLEEWWIGGVVDWRSGKTSGTKSEIENTVRTKSCAYAAIRESHPRPFREHGADEISRTYFIREFQRPS